MQFLAGRAGTPKAVQQAGEPRIHLYKWRRLHAHEHLADVLKRDLQASKTYCHSEIPS